MATLTLTYPASKTPPFGWGCGTCVCILLNSKELTTSGSLFVEGVVDTIDQNEATQEWVYGIEYNAGQLATGVTAGQIETAFVAVLEVNSMTKAVKALEQCIRDAGMILDKKGLLGEGTTEVSWQALFDCLCAGVAKITHVPVTETIKIPAGSDYTSSPFAATLSAGFDGPVTLTPYYTGPCIGVHPTGVPNGLGTPTTSLDLMLADQNADEICVVVSGLKEFSIK